MSLNKSVHCGSAESLEARRLLSSVSIPLNPVNLRPISDPDYTAIPVPRLVLGVRGTLEVIAPNTSDEISVSIQNIDGANRVVVNINDRTRTVRLRDVKRINIIGDGGLDDPQFFPQRGGDEIQVSGPAEFFVDRRVGIFGDNVQPAEARVDQSGNTFNFDGADTIVGGPGRDAIVAGGGINVVQGGAGNDNISSLDGNDTIGSGGGNDTVSAGAGLDLVTGDSGNDSLSSGADPDTVFGGVGNDTIDLGGVEAAVTFTRNAAEGGPGNDSIRGTNQRDTILGDEGNDTIEAQSGGDSILAGVGNDCIIGGQGSDTIYGGDGNDSLYGDVRNAESLSEPLAGSEADTDLIYGNAGNDSVWGESGDDKIFGGTGNDTLLGHFGEDSLSGDEGDDYLNGHEGFDRLNGGLGSDAYNEFDLTPEIQFTRRAEDNPGFPRRRWGSLQIEGPDYAKETKDPFDIFAQTPPP